MLVVRQSMSEVCTKHIFDWSSKGVSLPGNEELIIQDEDAVDVLKTLYHRVSPEVFEIRLSNTTNIASTSTDLIDDPN